MVYDNENGKNSDWQEYKLCICTFSSDILDDIYFY